MASEVVRFGDWIGGGWKLFTLQWQTWVLASLIHFVVFIIPLMFLMIGVYVPLLMHSEPNFLIIAPGLVIFPFAVLGSIFISGGMHRMAQKQLRGQKIEVRDVFSCKDCFGSLLLATLLVGLVAMCGLAVFCIGVYPVVACLFFTIPLIVDRGMSPVDAMKASYEFVKRDWLMFTLFVFVTMIISQIGANFCYIGLLATYPLLFTITAVAYRDCFGLEGADASVLGPETGAAPAIYSPPSQPGEVQNPLVAACPNCSAYMPTTAAFCPKCGLKR